jgi:hypothetical protein
MHQHNHWVFLWLVQLRGVEELGIGSRLQPDEFLLDWSESRDELLLNLRILLELNLLKQVDIHILVVHEIV